VLRLTFIEADLVVWQRNTFPAWINMKNKSKLPTLFWQIKHNQICDIKDREDKL